MTARAFFVPEVVQASAMDCGPAALKSMLEGFGVSVSYGRLREACQTSVDGTSIDTIEELAVTLGLDAEQVMLPHDHVFLDETNALPAIAVVRLPSGFTHFVVVWRRVGPLVQVMDPGQGRRWTTWRALAEELYSHSMPVPADAFRAYAGEAEFLGGLRRRFVEIGAAGDALIARAVGDASWRSIAALDATLRMVSALVRSGAILRGAEASGLLERFFDRALADPSAVPSEYWCAREHEDPEAVVLRGAVLVRVRSLRGRDADSPALGAELAAALAAPPERPLARLFEALREDGLAAPFAVLGALLFSAIGVAIEALVFRGAIDLGERLALPEQRIGLGAGVLALLALLLALQIPVSASALRLGRHLEARLRIAFLRKVPRLSDRYFHSRLTSDMAQRAHGIHALRSFAVAGAGLLSTAFSLAATVAGLVWLDPSHAIEVLFVAVLSIALPLALQPMLRDRDLRVQTHFGALTRFYLDALLGIVPIRAHGAERALRREHEGVLLEWERASTSFLRAAVATDVVTAIGGITLTAWLLFSYLDGGGAASGALLLVYWALRIPALGQQAAQYARQYPHLRNVALRVLEPLGAPEGPNEADTDPDADAHTHAPAGSAPIALGFDSVTVHAGGHVILDSVSADIAPGSRVAIVGASGAGKSTLVGLLLGWHQASSGRVLVDGAELDPARLRSLRSETAWVDPAVQLWNRTLVRNLRYGSDASRTSIARVIADAELVSLLDQLPDGMQSVLGEGGALVSGGEGQRVRLGRAMMRPGARLAILDEPFRGLDREARRRLLRASLDRFSGATVLCVTHDVSETTIFDRVLVVDGGRIVEDGTPDALLAREGSHYRALLEADRALAGALYRELRRITMQSGAIEEASP
jgi:ABC-type bacteriocin/lantibiotic exporter with double-glycine peptidase domain